METVKKIYLRSWRGIAIAVSLGLIAYLLYFHMLGNLLPGYSAPELSSFSTAKSWHNIFNNPVNAPYEALVWFFVGELHKGILVTRIVSACLALLLGLLFFVVVRNWCTYRTAFLVTVMFVTSGALLHFARLGTGYILQMGILALLSLVMWYRRSKNLRVPIGFGIVAISALLLYVPGMVWFELLGIVSLRRTIKSQLSKANTINLAGMVAVLLACIAPLLYASTRHPKVLLQITGLPQSMRQLSHFGHNLWITLISITARSYGSPLLWVGHAPLLSTVEVVIGLLGAYYVYRRTHRRVFLFGYAALGLVLVAFGNGVTVACLVPILYLFIAIGLDYLFEQWATVFPRNPVARITGVGIVSIMLAFSVLYQLRAYYVAWPHAPATRQIFSHIES